MYGETFSLKNLTKDPLALVVFVEAVGGDLKPY